MQIFKLYVWTILGVIVGFVFGQGVGIVMEKMNSEASSLVVGTSVWVLMTIVGFWIGFRTK